MTTILMYDGSFNGFLSAVFIKYEYKMQQVRIRKAAFTSKNLFDSIEEVITNDKKAERVWLKLKQKCSSKGLSFLYKAYLSEIIGGEDLMLKFIEIALQSEKCIASDYSSPVVLKLSQIAKKIHREKHRMEAFVRFKQTKDNIYFATISPDYNVLPLICSHFEKRYADQKWIIYDEKRNYGLYYNGNHVIIVKIDFKKDALSSQNKALFYTRDESDFQVLWKSYFKMTNIVSRKNTKLHLQHVPKRYWKYLTEKELY